MAKPHLIVAMVLVMLSLYVAVYLVVCTRRDGLGPGMPEPGSALTDADYRFVVICPPSMWRLFLPACYAESRIRHHDLIVVANDGFATVVW